MLEELNQIIDEMIASNSDMSCITYVPHDIFLAASFEAGEQPKLVQEESNGIVAEFYEVTYKGYKLRAQR